MTVCPSGEYLDHTGSVQGGELRNFSLALTALSYTLYNCPA